ncbi:MAG: hypothetical protein LBD38_04720 [Streptococcaceae bacterium]|jgi:hypothetical protein|nr:hypothetical protein [Streptococcaceae bacterium]
MKARYFLLIFCTLFFLTACQEEKELKNVSIGVISSTEVTRASYFIPLMRGQDDFSLDSKVKWQVEGIEFGNFPVKEGDSYYLVSNGTISSKNTILRISENGKILNRLDYPYGKLLSVAVSGDKLFGTNSNSVGEIFQLNKRGEKTASTEVKDGIIQFITEADGKLYALLEVGSAHLLYEYDANTLKKLREIDLTKYGEQYIHMVSTEDAFYLSCAVVPGESEQAPSYIVRVDKKTESVTKIQLHSTTPYQLVTDGMLLLVSHGSYVTDEGVHKISVIDLKTHSIKEVKTEGQPVQICLTKGSIFALTLNHQVQLFDREKLIQKHSWSLPEPGELDQTYYTNMIVNEQ